MSFKRIVLLCLKLPGIAVSSFDSPRYRRLAKESSWIVIGQIVSVLGALVLVRVLTEYLDPTQYGQLALGLTVAGLVNQVVMGGVSAGIGRYYSIAAEKQNLFGYLCASRRLIMYATMAVVIIGLILMSGLLLLGYFQWIGLATAVLVFSVFSGYNSTLSGVQNAARQRSIVAFHSGLDAWLKIFLAVGVMYWLGNSSTAVVIGYACSSLLVTVSQLSFLRRTILQQEISGHTEQSFFIRQIWAFSWPFSVWGIPSWAFQASSRWSIELFGTTNEVGLFQALNQIGFTPIQIIIILTMQFISPILFARSGDATSSERNRDVKKLVFYLSSSGLMLTLFASFSAWAFHLQIFNAFVAKKYNDVSYLLPWIVFAGGLLGVSQIFGSQLLSELRSKEMIPVGVISAIFGIIATIVFVYLFGVSGAVAALCLYACLNLCWLIRIAIK